MKLLLVFAMVSATFLVKAQNWNGTVVPTTTSDYNTQLQLTQIPWGSHHGILFNARRKAALNNGDLLSGGNIEPAFDAGSFTSGAGAILFLGNGGQMDFLVSGASTGVGQPLTSSDIKMTINRSGNVGIGTTSPSGTLDVNGTARIRSVAQNNTLTKILATDNSGNVFWRDASTISYVSVTNLPISINTLGIGTSTPTQTLDVNGNARIRGGLLVDNIVTLTQSRNIFLGWYTGTSTTGNYNTMMGYNSGLYNTTGYHNVFLGMESGYWNTTGTGNIFVGNYAGGINSTGSQNTAVGNSAGNTNGSNNVSIGVQAGARTGYTNNFSGSVFVGRAAGPIDANTYTNVVAIGENAVVGSNNAFVLGNSLHNIGIRQISPIYPLHVQNAYCDGNTWFNASDKNLKENFARIQTEESVLAKVLALPIQYWNYKGTSKARHIGPTAQDFHKTFQLGDNEHAIASVDEAGVALAAIQELAKKTEKLEQLLLAQQQLIASLLTSRGEDSGTLEKHREGLELQQNNPNPFSQETEIRMNIPQGIIEATLYVYDLQGTLMKSQLVTQRGATSVKFQAGSLNAGMYLYTLLADGQATSTKRMILTE